MPQKNFDSRLSLAIPKQDKLKKPITALLSQFGFQLTENEDSGLLIDRRGDIPNIRIEFVRAADALLLLERNIVDIAVIGSDVVDENTVGPYPRYAAPLKRMDLGIAECRFQIAVPKEQTNDFKDPETLSGKRIATSYPNLLQDWLNERDITAGEIVVREGGVEASIRMGLADVVADLVDTGGTLRRNGLSPAFTIAQTSAVLYARNEIECNTGLLVNEFLGRLQGIREATLALAA